MSRKTLSAAQGLEAACIVCSLNSKGAAILGMGRDAGLPENLLHGEGGARLCAEWRAFVHAATATALMQHAPNSVVLAYLRSTDSLLHEAHQEDYALGLHDAQKKNTPQVHDRAHKATSTLAPEGISSDATSAAEATSAADATSAATATSAAEATSALAPGAASIPAHNLEAFVDGPFAAYISLLAHERMSHCPALFLARLGVDDPEAHSAARLAAVMALVMSAIGDTLERYDILPD